MADSSRNIVLVLLVVGVAIALFYMMDPTFGGLLGKNESFQNAMAMNSAQPMPMQPTPEPILPPNNPGSVTGMKVENFQENQQNNVDALLAAQKRLTEALSAASNGPSTSGFANQKKEHFSTMKKRIEGFQSGSGAPTPAMESAQMMEQFRNKERFQSGSGAPTPAMESAQMMEQFQNPASTPFPEATQPANCYPKNQLAPQELLPSDPNSKWASVNPQGAGDISGKNFLSAGALIGVNTVGQSLRNANQQLRSEPACPQVQVSIWNQSTIEPDLQRRPLEGF